jgi:hypothetical protein
MSRKRKQIDMGLDVSSDESESDANMPAVPHTDENEINSIISKRLSSDDVEDVAEAMESLVAMTSDRHNKIFQRIVRLHFAAGSPSLLSKQCVDTELL